MYLSFYCPFTFSSSVLGNVKKIPGELEIHISPLWYLLRIIYFFSIFLFRFEKKQKCSVLFYRSRYVGIYRLRVLLSEFIPF